MLKIGKAYPWCFIFLLLACAEEGVTQEEITDKNTITIDQTSISPMLKLDESVDCLTQKRLPTSQLVRRLTKTEYLNTISALFDGVDPSITDAFPADEEMLGFDNQAKALQVSPVLIEQYQQVAEKLSDLSFDQYQKWVSCHIPEYLEINQDDAAKSCVVHWIEKFGLMAWRRPLNFAEKTRLFNLFVDALRLEEHQSRFAMPYVVQALLQSPHFIYRVEISEQIEESDMSQIVREFRMNLNADQLGLEMQKLKEQGLRKLNDYEIASRLSYLLWRSMPDEILLTAAENHELSHIDGLIEQANRMLLDQKAKQGLFGFFEQWLNLTKLSRIEKDVKAELMMNAEELKALWQTEARLFLDSIVFEEKNMKRLFSATHSFVNQKLAPIYGVEQELGDAFERVSLDPQQRSGIMTLAPILGLNAKANMSDPVHRGIFVREKLLCMPLPAPPPNVPVVAPDPDTSLTTRERFKEHSSNPICGGCHRLIDPIGFGLESFDELGMWRTEEKSKRIDTSGEFVDTVDLNGTFEGPVALSQRLEQAEHPMRCMVLQFFRFSMGRSETDHDLCDIYGLYDHFAENNYDFQSLLMNLISSHQFRYRLHEEIK
jgi:hypothetical protein